MNRPRDRLEQLYDDHGAAVLAYGRRRASLELAEEVLSETFLVAWRRIEEVPAAAERPWLLGVARRVLANQLRSARRRDALDDRLEAETRLLEAPAGGDAARLGVAGAVAALPELQREIVRLVFWDGLTPAQAATVLGTSALAARGRLHRALRTLRATLAETDSPSSNPVILNGGRHVAR